LSATAVDAVPRAAAHEPFRPGYGLSAARLADRTIAFLVFISGFVIVEPSPYDLLIVAVVLVWAFFGLKLNRHFLPMTVLMLAYLAGGLLSLTQMSQIIGKPIVYMITTGLLIASAIFYASVVSEAPQRRLRLIRNAYVAAAIVVSLIAILAYFNVLPHSDYFKLYERAKGTFQDPNVMGPFLVLPGAVLVRDILTRRLRESLWTIPGFLIILFAIFLSFSRAAWGLMAFVALAVAFLAFINEPRQRVRFRLVGYLLGGAATVIVLLAVLISIPAVRDLYEVRAHVVQSYDDSRVGRFERQYKGFFLVQEKPLGIGPEQFAPRFGEDEHDMWLKGFTTYGWLGGFSYIILAAWTLAAAFPLLFKPRPWTPFIQCTYVVLLGHLFIHNVIDNDHWRHLYLIYGVLWGAIAAEKMLRRQRVGRDFARSTPAAA
jgi:hypothetical protein